MPPGRNAFVRSERCAKSEVGASEGRTTKVGVTDTLVPRSQKSWKYQWLNGTVYSYDVVRDCRC